MDKHGKLNGYGKLYNKEGIIKEEGTFKSGELDTYGKS